MLFRSYTLTSNMQDVAAGAAEIHQELNRLKAVSEEITGIIGLVKQVSDQTNLLALNASIEAARAGEHGRGFEVVAAEIRKLSDQTRKAVDDVSTLIHNSLAQVAKVADSMQLIDGKLETVHHGVVSTLDNFQDIRQSMADMRKVSEEIAKELEAACIIYTASARPRAKWQARPRNCRSGRKCLSSEPILLYIYGILCDEVKRMAVRIVRSI